MKSAKVLALFCFCLGLSVQFQIQTIFDDYLWIPMGIFAVSSIIVVVIAFRAATWESKKSVQKLGAREDL